jgi:hypothetical protein
MAFEKINGDWGKAENLGPNINTKSDEIAPFLSASGRVLFFASQGHQNMGGFDIFYSKLEQNKWMPAVNIGSQSIPQAIINSISLSETEHPDILPEKKTIRI